MSREMRGTGTIYLRGKTYWIQYCSHGRVRKESSRSRERKDAVKLLKLRFGESAHGPLVGPAAERLTITELMQGLENEQRRKGNRTSAKATQERMIEYFGPKARALDITATKIVRYIAERQARGLSNASSNRELACLRHAFNVAVKEGRLGPGHVPSFPHYDEGEPRDGFVDPGDLSRLVDALPEYLKDFVEFLYLTGWRIGELRSLEWRDLDLEDRTVRLRAQNSKTKKPRIIKLAGATLDIIARAHAKRRLDCRYVFYRVARRADGTEKVWPIGDIRKRWANALKATGLSEGLIRHDFRRSAVRNMIRAGISERVAMAMSGHKTRSVFDRYHIVSEADLDDAAIKMDQYVRERRQEAPKVVNLTR